MFGIENLTGSSQAAALVGVVLVEAMVLYVGYGALTRALTPTVKSLVGSE